MVNGFTAVAAGGLLLGLLGGAPMAFAQNNSNAGTATGTEQGAAGAGGVTSGPAVGTPVMPSGAVQKHAKNMHGRKHRGMASAESAGAPGTSAKPGTEAGPAPRHHHHLRTASRAGHHTSTAAQAGANVGATTGAAGGTEGNTTH